MFEWSDQSGLGRKLIRPTKIWGAVSLVLMTQWACGWWEFHPSTPTNLRGECPAEMAVGETLEFRVYVHDHIYRLLTLSTSMVDITPDSAGVVRITDEGRYEEYEDEIVDTGISFTAQQPGEATLSWREDRCHFIITQPDQAEDQTVVQDFPEIDIDEHELVRVSVLADGVPVEPGGSLAVPSGQPVQLEAIPENLAGPISFSWEPADGLSDPSVANPVATAEETTAYTVTAADSDGNHASQTLSLEVASIEDSGVFLRSFICDGDGLTVRFDGIASAEVDAPTPVYAAHVANFPYACSTWSGLPGSVLCTGSLSPQGTEAPVELVAETEGRILYSAPHAVPMCSAPGGGSGSGSGGGSDPDPTPFVCPPPEDCS